MLCTLIFIPEDIEFNCNYINFVDSKNLKRKTDGQT